MQCFAVTTAAASPISCAGNHIPGGGVLPLLSSFSQNNTNQCVSHAVSQSRLTLNTFVGLEWRKTQFSHSAQCTVAQHLVESLHEWKSGPFCPFCSYLWLLSVQMAFAPQNGFWWWLFVCFIFQSLLVPSASPGVFHLDWTRRGL